MTSYDLKNIRDPSFQLIFLVAAYVIFDQASLPTPEISQTPSPMVTQVVQ